MWEWLPFIEDLAQGKAPLQVPNKKKFIEPIEQVCGVSTMNFLVFWRENWGSEQLGNVPKFQPLVLGETVSSAQANFTSRSGSLTSTPYCRLALPRGKVSLFWPWETSSPRLSDKIWLKTAQTLLGTWSPGLGFLVNHGACWETGIAPPPRRRQCSTSILQEGAGLGSGVGSEEGKAWDVRTEVVDTQQWMVCGLLCYDLFY